MNTRARLFASIGIPVLLIIVVVGAFIWQQRAAGSGMTGPTQPVSGSVCSSLKSSASQPLTTMRLALDWTPNTNRVGIARKALIYNSCPIRPTSHPMCW